VFLCYLGYEGWSKKLRIPGLTDDENCLIMFDALSASDGHMTGLTNTPPLVMAHSSIAERDKKCT